MPSERDLTRRWRNRLATGDPRLDPPPVSGPQIPEPTELPDDATRLLSSYEDAVHASARHNIVPTGLSATDENAHMLEARRLHADVRRLRAEVLALLDVALGENEPKTDL